MSNIIAAAIVRRSPRRIIVIGAVLAAASIVAVILLANPLNRPQTAVRLAAVETSPSIGSVSAAIPSSAASVPAAAAPAANQSKFVCMSSILTNSKPHLPAFVEAIRTGAHPGYDRLTIQFQNGQPGSVRLAPQSGTTFVRSPRGAQVTLAGRNGIVVTLFSSDGHTAYSGPTDIKTGDSTLVEVRAIQDFEGYVQYALGISGPACYRTMILTNPTRLVIDVQAS